jgi:hypothetical protein
MYILHPLVRREFLELYKSHVSISSNPTDSGEYLKVTDFYYPVKRLRNKSLRGFDKDLWVLMRQAEEKGLI